MDLQILDRFTIASGAANEDVSGHAGRMAWVLDGATGLTDRRLLPGPSDARWYALALDEALRRRAGELSCALPQVLADAIEEVARRFRSEAAGAAEAYELPSAAVVLTRAVQEGVEFLVLGDCRALLAGPDGCRSVGHSPLNDFDRETAGAIRALHARGVRDPKAVFQQMLPLVRRQRARMNRPDGYWIASLDPQAAAHGVQGELPVGPGAKILLLSDGLYRLVDVLDAYDDDRLLAAAAARGLAALGDELRRRESTDAACLAHPRLKPMDDATGLLCALTPSSGP